MQFRATTWGAEHASSLAFAGLRAAPAAVALGLFAAIGRSRWPTRRLWPWAGGVGLLMVTVNAFALTEGTPLAGSANMAVLVNTAPFVILLMSHSFLNEPVTRVAVAGLAVGFGGVVLLVSTELGAEGAGSDLLLGIALGLVASITWSVGTLIVKWLSDRDDDLDPLGFTAGMYLVGGSVLVLLALTVDSEGTSETDWSSATLWASTAFVSLGAAALGTVAYFAALGRLPAGRAGAWLFLPPVVAVLVEIALGEPPRAAALIGIALAVGGVVMVNRAPNERG